jgi:hypothetical protein
LATCRKCKIPYEGVRCVPCRKKQQLEYYSNPEVREKRKLRVQNWRIQNNEKIKSVADDWRHANKDKVAAKASRRHVRRKQATPKWLTKRQKFEIRKKYRTVKILNILEGSYKYSVDHIHPIYSDDASGLHVPWNLQIIDRIENIKKACKRSVL